MIKPTGGLDVGVLTFFGLVCTIMEAGVGDMWDIARELCRWGGAWESRENVKCAVCGQFANMCALPPALTPLPVARVSLQVDPKFLKNMRFAKKHNKAPKKSE